MCLFNLVLCPQGSGKSSRPEQVYQIPFFTHPTLNFMENKIEKEKKKKNQSRLPLDSIIAWNFESAEAGFLRLTTY